MTKDDCLAINNRIFSLMTPSKCLPREAIKRPKKLKKNAYEGIKKKSSSRAIMLSTYRELVKSKDFGLES